MWGLGEGTGWNGWLEFLSASLARELGQDPGGLPDYIQIQLDDERAFSCLTWIWQGWLFHRWLRCPTPEEAIGKAFRVLWVVEWARKQLPIPRCVKILDFPDNRELVPMPIQVPSPYVTVKKYLVELERLGFLRKDSGDTYIVVRNDLFELNRPSGSFRRRSIGRRQR